MIFIHKGREITHYDGKYPVWVWRLPYYPGVIYQIDFDTAVNRLLYVESFAPIYTPKRYKNESGQHLEHAPFCERDFILPTELETHDEKGDFLKN
jgi:homogentisate 1,2-dioxygenase